MISNYDRIRKYLEYGFMVKGHTKDGDFIIFSSLMDNGGIRSSQFDVQKDCFNCLGCSFDTEKDINEIDFLSLTPIVQKPKMFQVGDLVDVTDNEGKILTSGATVIKINDGITTYLGGYDVKKQDEKIMNTIPHWCVLPHIPEETSSPEKPDNSVEQEAIELLRKNGYEIIKKS